MNDKTLQKLAVLFADVSGSTRLYERVGDEIARADIKTCLDLLTEVATSREGKVLKTIGDEVMCIFTNPVNAALAAREMQSELWNAGEAGRFQSGNIRIKIGWHYGPVEWRQGDVIGEAPITAQQIIGMAKADEILTSENTLEALPQEQRGSANFLDTVAAECWSGSLKVYSLVWKEEEDATVVTSSAPVELDKHATLVLKTKDREVHMDEVHWQIRMGRGQENELCVTGRYTSRHHADIMYRHGHFILFDISTNGTVVVDTNEDIKRLHREEMVLTGKGIICCGGTPETDPDAVVHYQCT